MTSCGSERTKNVPCSTGDDAANPPRLLLLGTDSLYVSYYLDLASSALDFVELDFQKRRAGEAEERFVELALGSETFALKPYGAFPYRLILSNDAFNIQLGERIQPSCYVQCLSERLWLDGRQAVIERFERWRQSIGATVLRPEVVSRADFAFDFALAAADFAIEDFVSRARKDAAYRDNGALQTVAFGRGDVMVRVYDKPAEIEQQSGKAFFYDLWGQREGVWRVEFQVRRERLHAGGIDDVATLSDCEGDLLRELASSHTSLRRPNGDTNRSRWPCHPLWRALGTAIEAMPQTGLVRAMDPAAMLIYRRERQLRSLHGSFKGLAAVLQLLAGQSVALPLPELLERLPGLLAAHHNAAVWTEDVERRMRGHALGQW